MRQEPVEAHGSVYPADTRLVETVNAVLRDWNLSECASLEGDILKIAFWGVCFPLDDVITAISPSLHDAGENRPASSGKIDLFDLEEWRLTRAVVSGRDVRVSSSDLNTVLAYSGF